MRSILPFTHHERDDFAAGVCTAIDAGKAEPGRTETDHGAITFVDLRHREQLRTIGEEQLDIHTFEESEA